MPFINDIVELLNASLKSSLSSKRFQPANFIGVVRTIARNINKTTAEFIPGVVDNTGEVTPVEWNDVNNLTIYHRMINNSHSKVAKSYGSDNELSDITEMQMIVFGWSNKLELNADSLEAIIRVNLPGQLPTVHNSLGLSRCMISTTGTDHDTFKIFKQELPQAAYFLRPENILFLIKYRIETSFNKQCLSQCCPG